jgi:hypothetical protein
MLTLRARQLFCRLLWLMSSLCLLAPWSAPCARASTFVVARTGDAAPDAMFLRFGSPVINSEGEVAFQSFLLGPTTDVVPHGVFVGTASESQAIAIAGAFSDVGSRYRTPGPPNILTANRQALFYGNLVHGAGVTSENDYGVWAGPPADVQITARHGDQAPGLPTGVNYSLFVARPTSSGALGIAASLQGEGVNETNSNAAWVGSMAPNNQLELIARAGDFAPGLPANSRFLSLGAPAVNSAGQFLMGAAATNSGAPGSVVTGIWSRNHGDLELLVSSLSVVPAAPGRHFTNFHEAGFNHRGDFAYLASLDAESNEDYLSDAGIWVGNVTGESLELVAREGDAAPEFGENAVFRGSVPGEEPFHRVFSNPVLGGSGRVAFVATVSGDGIDFDHNDGVWVSDPSLGGGDRPRLLVAREGEQPPEAPEGTVFVGQNFGEDLISAFERPLLATSGQVAFEASTNGPWGDAARGIWGTDRHGELHLIAHTGTEWQVAPGDRRVISLLKMHGGGSSDDGYLSAINDVGQIAFSLNFEDGTEAVVVASLQPGDTDADGDVDLEDLNNVRNHFGEDGGGDTNRDGIVDLIDLNNVRNYFGDGTTPKFVPEPSTGTIAVLTCLSGILGGVTMKRRRCGLKITKCVSALPLCAAFNVAWCVILAAHSPATAGTLYWTTYHYDNQDPQNVHGELFGLHRASTNDIAGTREELIHQLGYQPEYNALAANGGAAFVLEYFNRTQHDYSFEGPADLTSQAGAELIGAAIDSVGNTYIADAETGMIRRGDFEYENQADFIDTGHVFQPSLVVALDEPHGMIYWAGACSGCPLRIGRANLDGTGIEELPIDVPFDDYPVDLAIDSAAGKLYWTNSPAGAIQRSNLDGSDIEDVVTGVTAFSLALDMHPVPEPSTVGLAVGGVLSLFLSPRLRRRSGRSDLTD